MRCVGLFLIAVCASAQSNHISNIVQLTHGGQNAEAYWSPNGKKLVFQTTRDKFECDQIFVMNADGTDQQLASTGKGRTTCGYFMPDNKHILYASTHESGDACPTPPDRSKGYVWAVYPTYDIFVANLKGEVVKKLTKAAGYDAEATVNFKHKKIVYTSMATGDLELWTMSTQGLAKHQITKSPGYDGGAVFSRDGKLLAWRGNHPESKENIKKYQDLLRENLTTPMKMEIMVSDSKGKDVREITHFGCASFAPTFTPDGKKIIFSSNKNKCDSRDFELFMIDVDGKNLAQITNLGGFTSFPEISPDGKKIVFASSYQAKERYEFNIFVADWKK